MSRNVVFPFSSLEVRWIPVVNDVLSDSCYLGRGKKAEIHFIAVRF